MNENMNTSVENTNTTVNVKAMSAAQVEFEMAEKLVKLKYPHLKIVDNSLTQEANHPTYGNKRRVKVACPHCGAIVERATSDLFTFKACPACLKGVRKAAKLEKKVALLQAVAAAENAADTENETDEQN